MIILQAAVALYETIAFLEDNAACLHASFLATDEIVFYAFGDSPCLEKKMVPANPVDRTVQQAGKHRTREKTRLGKTKKKQYSETLV